MKYVTTSVMAVSLALLMSACGPFERKKSLNPTFGNAVRHNMNVQIVNPDAGSKPAVAPDMNGTERAALLLMTLGEKEAAEVLKYMGANEVQRLGMAMAQLKNVSRNQADQGLDVFITDVEDQTALGVDTENYVRKLLGNAFGKSKANTFIERIMTGDDAQGLDALKWMSSREVVDIVEDEHPQIVAIVLSFLDSQQAAEVLELMPEEVRSDIVMRVARLTDIQQSALAEQESLVSKSNKLLTRQLALLEQQSDLAARIAADRQANAEGVIAKDAALAEKLGRG